MDTQAFSDRAGARSDKIGLDDVMLAIQAKAATSFVVPPSQEVQLLQCTHAPITATPCNRSDPGKHSKTSMHCIVLCLLQMLQAMAERRNSVALPSTATAKYGFRLPPAEDCLIAPNIQFRPRDPPQHVDWEDEVISAGACTRLQACEALSCTYSFACTVCMQCSACAGLYPPRWYNTCLTESHPCLSKDVHGSVSSRAVVSALCHRLQNTSANKHYNNQV